MSAVGQRSLHQTAVDQFQRAAKLIDLKASYKEILAVSYTHLTLPTTPYV